MERFQKRASMIWYDFHVMKLPVFPMKKIQVMRTLAPIFQHQDLDTYPEPSFDVRDLTIPTNNVRRDHYKVIRDIGEEALTLVKNNRESGGGLPLPKPSAMRSLAVIGEDASASPYGATSCGDGGSSCQIDNNGTTTIGGGSGWAYPPYTIDPLAAINAYVRADGPDINQHLENWDLAAAVLQASRSETALVFISAYAAEGADRRNLTAFSNGDALVKAVAAANNNTIVVMHIPGPVLVEEWIDHENVTAVLIAHLPGQESGNALVPVLWGEKSPSGKMPYTIAKDESGSYLLPTPPLDDVFRTFQTGPRMAL
jgi:beta-glucosidase